MSVNDFKIELDLAFANARQIKQIIDQASLQLHVAVDHLERFTNILRQGRLILQGKGGREYRCKRSAQLVAEHGKKLIFREIRACLFLQLQVRFLQLVLSILEFHSEQLRLFEQVFRPRVCSNRIEDNADALRQLIEKRLMGGGE